MTFRIALAGTVAHSTTKTVSGAPAPVPHWPANGSRFKGYFDYSPSATVAPALFPTIYLDFGAFTFTRQTGAGAVNLENGGAGIAYGDSFSTGFGNVSLPHRPWELQGFGMVFTNPQNFGVVNPAALNFDLFTERTFLLNGDDGVTNNHVLFTVLARIDVTIELPA
jgi:hypothetical protein